MSAQVTWFERIAESRPPDFVIQNGELPYLKRWWVIPRNRFFNIYLHCFDASDDDRALHDHPWFNLSVVLSGAYREHTRSSATERCAGAFKFRSPWAAHRIELLVAPTWTLFITGPVIRTWGFHCPQGWRRWQDYVANGEKGKIGRGCE